MIAEIDCSIKNNVKFKKLLIQNIHQIGTLKYKKNERKKEREVTI